MDQIQGIYKVPKFP
jgi:hypothetical protein